MVTTQERITAMETNLPLIAQMLDKLRKSAYPGITSHLYSRDEKILTLRYIGVTVIWNAYANRALIQEGNTGRRIRAMDGNDVLQALEEGVKGFTK